MAHEGHPRSFGKRQQPSSGGRGPVFPELAAKTHRPGQDVHAAPGSRLQPLLRGRGPCCGHRLPTFLESTSCPENPRPWDPLPPTHTGNASEGARATGAGCRQGPGGPGRYRRNTPSLKVIIPREKEAISQFWYDYHFASSSVFAGVCEISLIKDSVRLALPPQHPRTSIWEPPGGGRKLGHGRQPPDPPALVAGAALKASGLCSLLFPASANLATWTRPDRRAPLLTAAASQPGRRVVHTRGKATGDGHSHRWHRTRQQRGLSGSWRTARAGQENASLPFTRVSFNPDRDAAVRAVVS